MGGASRLSVNIREFETSTQLSVIPDPSIDRFIWGKDLPSGDRDLLSGWEGHTRSEPCQSQRHQPIARVHDGVRKREEGGERE